MLEDAVKETERQEELSVRDIAEVVADNLPPDTGPAAASRG
jgi:hypothetical protein